MPPKKKGAGKKPRTAMLINGLSMEEMTSEQIEELSLSLREQLVREREERDRLRRERDSIHAAGKITDRWLEEAEAELQNLEKELEDDERRYQVEVKVYKQKMKHVLHEHQNTMSGLRADGSVSTEVLQEEQEQSEAELHEETGDLHRLDYEKIKAFETKLEEEMTESGNSLVKNISEMKSTYEEKLKSQQQVLEDMTRKLAKEREDHWRSHIDCLKKDHDVTYAEAERVVDHLKCEKTDSVKRKIEKLLDRQIENHKRLVVLSQNNRNLTESLLNIGEQIAKKEKKIQYCETKRDTSEQHHMKALNDLKLQHEDLEQKFSKLQLEREEQYMKHCQTSEIVQREADLQVSVREKKLKALTERLDETRAQLHSVLSASNMDQTAFARITKTIEENLDSCNKSIKNLQDKKAQISKAHKDLLLSFEAKQSDSGERP